MNELFKQRQTFATHNWNFALLISNLSDQERICQLRKIRTLTVAANLVTTFQTSCFNFAYIWLVYNIYFPMCTSIVVELTKMGYSSLVYWTNIVFTINKISNVISVLQIGIIVHVRKSIISWNTIIILLYNTYQIQREIGNETEILV